MGDTKPINVSETKCCSKCGKTKIIEHFIKNRNICKECYNLSRREKYKEIEINNSNQICNICNETKDISSFIKNRKVCKSCNNKKRRENYKNNENQRLKIVKYACDLKHNKVIENQKRKEEEKKKIETEIGEENKICKYCNKITLKTNFRDKRLKCKNCERDEPLEKFKRTIRTRIYIKLNTKDKHTIDYLGCNTEEYLKWICFNTNNYNLENHGKDWHIDHIIPLSKFNLDNQEEQLIAFNWRNTMPLSIKDNLTKNNKILKPQIQQHLIKILEYHNQNKIQMPQEFIKLFAKHLDAGTPLEPLLPLHDGNIVKELG